MKTLITHINPHLDDIASIWLFQRFQPDFTDSQIEFISQGKSESVVESEDKVYLGVGKGQFDEHKGDLEDCATSLVYKYLVIEKSIPEVKKAALDELVEWVKLGDLGRLLSGPYDDFSVPAFIRPDDSTQEGSLRATELGEEILDRILKVLIEKHQAQNEWEGRVEFDSKFGKSFGVLGVAINRAFCKSTGSGELYLMYNPQNHWAQYFTPSIEIDLEPIYQKLTEMDPDSDWFLHQSHHMVICGSGSSPDSKGTKLSFEELIEVAKSI